MVAILCIQKWSVTNLLKTLDQAWREVDGVDSPVTHLMGSKSWMVREAMKEWVDQVCSCDHSQDPTVTVIQ